MILSSLSFILAPIIIMASELKSLSDVKKVSTKLKATTKVAIVVADWNSEITHSLMDGAVSFLLESGIKKQNILIHHVPGTFELVLGAQLAFKQKVDGVICLGCVIQGDTPHFTFICDATANGIMDLNIKHDKPVIFGVLTTLTHKQAQERSGGKHGNKGVEAAATLTHMLILKNALKK
jgi:6,7-dimethyl-8-ribityllumazine synthase